jgi:acyl-CoA thioester hydrolase
MPKKQVMKFRKQISLRWADLDPNFHMRHSVYYDLGAQQRIELLHHLGLTSKAMMEQHFGPVIFREECVFKKEIKLGDTVFITTKLAKMKPDASRWTIQHELLNEEDQVLALITLDGAWIDTQLRKLVKPTPQIVTDVFNLFPKSEDFVEL